MELTKEQAMELCDSIELNNEFFDEDNEEYILLKENNPHLFDAYSVLFTIACSELPDLEKENEKLKADIQVLALALDKAGKELKEATIELGWGTDCGAENFKELAKQYLKD